MADSGIGSRGIGCGIRVAVTKRIQEQQGWNVVNAKRWQQIEELFQNAVELHGQEREDFLVNACGPDSELLDEVRGLLAADEKPHSILSGMAADALAISETESWIGRQIGVYRITGEIGAGGMGVVLAAERADGEFHQQVAIKLVKRGMDSDEIIRRFQRERQILARLKHPNIAMLLGGGVTNDGRPYFVMEFIDGLPIDIYCDQKALSIDDRLQLFLKVCETVAFAQRSLVVHRDLKPSNILVTTAGEIKLLDFGIAKVISVDSESDSVPDLTRTGMRIMTPEYASPEQLLGDPATTASDVYSLGVILYQLLTGSSPHQGSGRHLVPVDRTLETSDPKRPSQSIASDSTITREQPDSSQSRAFKRSTDIRQLRRRLTGDLDNICLKALRQDPERRYHSAEHLHDDIHRHLRGLPITARPDTMSYRAAKFVGRHRRILTAAAVSFCALVTLVIYYTVQLSEERDRARVEAVKAQEVSHFLTGIFSLADPNESQGSSITARELLDSGAVRLAAELAGQPETQAEMMDLLASIYFNMSQLDKARELARQALEIRQSIFGAKTREVALSLHLLGMIEDAGGNYDSAVTHYTDALLIQEDLFGKADSLTAEIKTDLGRAMRHQGKLDDAEQLLREALETRRFLFGDTHEDIAHSLNNLGRLLYNRRDFAAAEPMLREAVDITIRIRGELHAETAAALGALGALMIETGNLNAAESTYSHAQEIVKKLFGDDHVHGAGLLSSVAEIAYRKGEFARSDSLYRRVDQIFRVSFAEFHPQLAVPANGIGRNFMATNQPDSAKSYFEEALLIRRRSLGDDHWQTGVSMTSLGGCLRDLGYWEDSESLLIEGFRLASTQFGESDIRTRRGASELFKLYKAWGRPDKALEYEPMAEHK